MTRDKPPRGRGVSPATTRSRTKRDVSLPKRTTPSRYRREHRSDSGLDPMVTNMQRASGAAGGGQPPAAESSSTQRRHRPNPQQRRSLSSSTTRNPLPPQTQRAIAKPVHRRTSKHRPSSPIQPRRSQSTRKYPSIVPQSCDAAPSRPDPENAEHFMPAGESSPVISASASDDLEPSIRGPNHEAQAHPNLSNPSQPKPQNPEAAQPASDAGARTNPSTSVPQRGKGVYKNLSINGKCMSIFTAVDDDFMAFCLATNKQVPGWTKQTSFNAKVRLLRAIVLNSSQWLPCLVLASTIAEKGLSILSPVTLVDCIIAGKVTEDAQRDLGKDSGGVLRAEVKDVLAIELKGTLKRLDRLLTSFQGKFATVQRDIEGISGGTVATKRRFWYKFAKMPTAWKDTPDMYDRWCDKVKSRLESVTASTPLKNSSDFNPRSCSAAVAAAHHRDCATSPLPQTDLTPNAGSDFVRETPGTTEAAPANRTLFQSLEIRAIPGVPPAAQSEDRSSSASSRNPEASQDAEDDADGGGEALEASKGVGTPLAAGDDSALDSDEGDFTSAEREGKARGRQIVLPNRPGASKSIVPYASPARKQLAEKRRNNKNRKKRMSQKMSGTGHGGERSKPKSKAVPEETVSPTKQRSEILNGLLAATTNLSNSIVVQGQGMPGYNLPDPGPPAAGAASSSLSQAIDNDQFSKCMTVLNNFGGKVPDEKLSRMLVTMTGITKEKADDLSDGLYQI